MLGILSVIALLSFLVAPIFQTRLNQRFMLGARKVLCAVQDSTNSKLQP